MSDAGLYCPAGEFHVDPWRPVARAVLTHAHGDHARPGSDAYLVSAPGLPLYRTRLGDDATLEPLAYGERRRIGAADVSLHPAGHVLGSAQVAIAHAGRTWVVSGDYKTTPDPTCAPFAPVRCDLFLTESTFGLPIYRFPPADRVVGEILEWWEDNRVAGRTSVLFAYALGKAQRVLASLPAGAGPVFCHGAIERVNRAYREAGIALPHTRSAADAPTGFHWAQALVIAPPSAATTPWMRRFLPCSTAFASGWMAVRRMRRSRAVDRGFVLSDHADWDGLNAAVAATGAAEVWVTHGYGEAFARWLRERTGRAARAIATRFEGEAIEDGIDAAAAVGVEAATAIGHGAARGR